MQDNPECSSAPLQEVRCCFARETKMMSLNAMGKSMPPGVKKHPLYQAAAREDKAHQHSRLNHSKQHSKKCDDSREIGRLSSSAQKPARTYLGPDVVCISTL